MSKRIEEIISIFSCLIGDLTIAVEVLNEFESRSIRPDKKRQTIWRLCFFSIIMSCRKYVEACEKYGTEINEICPSLKSLKGIHVDKINRNSAIVDLRNHYVAHVQKKSEKRALSDQEVQAYIIQMIGSEDATEFLNWICPDSIENSNEEECLVGAIEKIRDEVAKKL